MPSSIDGIVTASSALAAVTAHPGGRLNGTKRNMTASIMYQFQEAINNQTATRVVAGYTNTLAPSNYFSALTSSAGSILTLTSNAGSTDAITTNFGSTTASVAVSTNGLDTWEYDQGTQTFDARKLPYSNFPRK